MNLIEVFAGLPAENRAETLKGFVEQVKNLKNCSNLVLAKVLYEIEQDGYYNEWTYKEDGVEKKFSSINDFARVNFEYSSSTTQSFLRIHEKFAVQLQVPDEKLAQLPWGNLRIVCPHVTAENLDRVLKLCEGKQKDVKAWASQFQETSEKSPRYSFTCSLEQAEVFDSALDLARDMYAQEVGEAPLNDTAVWEYIVVQYLKTEPKPLTLVDHLTLLESRFDVKLGLRDEAPLPPTVAEESAPKEAATKPATSKQSTSKQASPAKDTVKGTPFEELFPLAPEDNPELPEVLSVEDFR